MKRLMDYDYDYYSKYPCYWTLQVSQGDCFEDGESDME